MKRRSALATTQTIPRKKARTTNTSPLAVTQAIVRKELRKNTDWKYTDVSLANANMTSTGSVTSLLNNMVRGDTGLDNFGGNIVTPQAITFRYSINTSQTFNLCRVIIFQWFDSAIPSVAGILQSTATSIATMSPILITNKSYIKVLHDQTHSLAPTASGDTTVLGYGVTEPTKVYIPGKRLRPIRFNATANTVQDGNIYMLLISDDSVINYPQITLYSRITFSDND